MVPQKSDLEVIECYFREKGWHVARLCREVPFKGWNIRVINRVIKHIETHGSAQMKAGSGRPKTASTDANNNYVSNQPCRITRG